MGPSNQLPPGFSESSPQRSSRKGPPSALSPPQIHRAEISKPSSSSTSDQNADNSTVEIAGKRTRSSRNVSEEDESMNSLPARQSSHAGHSLNASYTKLYQSASRSASHATGHTSSRSESPFNTQTLSHKPSFGTNSSAAPSPVPASMLTPAVAHLPSRHLVTIIPPDYLPHDPPHPRTSPFCTGYGPPQNFRRGVLVPLYPTLSGQIGAIAREYGLPSTGGIVLYLVETTSDLIDNGLNQAFAGGPRIGDDAWQLLWARLFEAEAEEREQARLFATTEDEADPTSLEEESFESPGYRSMDHRAPPVPPIPSNHLYRQPNSSVEEDSLPTPSTDASSSHLGADQHGSADSSYADVSIGSGQRRQVRTHSDAYSRPFSSLSNKRHVSAPQRSRYSEGYPRPSTSYSMRSMPVRSPMMSSFGGYGSSVIVGKLEFDIDRRRGGSRWFDTWAEGAQNPIGLGSSPLVQQPSQNSTSSRISGIEAARMSQASRSSQSSFSPHQSVLFSPANGPRRSSVPTLYSSTSSQTRVLNGEHLTRASKFTTADDTTGDEDDVEVLTDSHPQDHQVVDASLTSDVDSLMAGNYQELVDVEPEDSEETQVQPLATASADRKSVSQTQDPLADVFGEHDWPARTVEGLGISGTSPDIDESDDPAKLPPVDEVQEIKDLLHRNSEAEVSSSLLSSPIHLLESEPISVGHEPELQTEAETTVPGLAASVEQPLQEIETAPLLPNRSIAEAESTSTDKSVPEALSHGQPPTIHDVLDNHRPDASIMAETHSQSSSFDMNENFDNLERALAELSPRGRRSPRTPRVDLPSPSMASQQNEATPHLPTRKQSRPDLQIASDLPPSPRTASLVPQPSVVPLQPITISAAPLPQRSTFASSSKQTGPANEAAISSGNGVSMPLSVLQAAPISPAETIKHSPTQDSSIFAAPREAPNPVTPVDTPRLPSATGQSLRLKKSWSKQSPSSTSTNDRPDVMAQSASFLQKFGFKRKASGTEPASLPTTPILSNSPQALATADMTPRSKSFDMQRAIEPSSIEPTPVVAEGTPEPEALAPAQPDIMLSRFSSGANVLLHEGSPALPSAPVGLEDVMPMSPNRRYGFAGKQRSYNLENIASAEDVSEDEEEVSSPISPTAQENIGNLMTS